LEFGHLVELLGNPVRNIKDALQMTREYGLITAIQNHLVDGRWAALKTRKFFLGPDLTRTSIHPSHFSKSPHLFAAG
jgi:hypothetical protein